MLFPVSLPTHHVPFQNYCESSDYLLLTTFNKLPMHTLQHLVLSYYISIYFHLYAQYTVISVTMNAYINFPPECTQS